MRPVIGIDQPTNQSGVWDGDQLTILRTYRDEDLGGDGTVPRVSASPQEADSDEDAMFSIDKHASLQNAEGVHTQVRGWVNSIDLGDFKALAPVTVTVDTAEVHREGESVSVRLAPSSATLRLEASLTWVAGPVLPTDRSATVDIAVLDGMQEIEFPARQPGVYRLHVEGEEVEPVTDLVVIAPA